MKTQEVRWFLAGDSELHRAWFFGPDQKGPVESRTDTYLIVPSDEAVGIKSRNAGDAAKGSARFETKIRLTNPLDLPLWGSVRGRSEAWFKISVEERAIPGLSILRSSLVSADAHKERVLIKYQEVGGVLKAGPEVPAERLGCQVELTTVTINSDEVWTTFGFGCFGPEARQASFLQRVARQFFTKRSGRPFRLTYENSSAYPAWLLRNCGN